MDVVCEPVQQSAGQPLRTEHLGPLVERRVGGHEYGATLVALTEDLEEQFRTGPRQRHEAEFVYDQQLQAREPLLQVQQPHLVPCLHKLVHQGQRSGEAHCQSLLAGGKPQAQRDVRLAGFTVAYGDGVLATLYVLASGELGYELSVHRRYGREVEGVQAMRRRLTGDLYKRYLLEIMDVLQDDNLPEDWLALSSGVLSGIIRETLGHQPSWCGQITWNDYAGKRYDRVKAALQSLLRPASFADEEGSTPRGWTLDGDRIIVWEPQDAFERRSFGWEDVPSTLIDSDTTQGNVTFLVRSEVEGFLGTRIHAQGRFGGLRRLFGR